ncbi:hypothetical protein KAU40_02630 [Candidatus Parcubacteria bacterium]|nr:hypothetical protein [Candidatus Parcubacteria bacterium]
MKILFKIILPVFIFIGIFLSGSEFYQINQELRIVKLENEEKIKNLKEKLAEEEIKSKEPVGKTELNPVEIAKKFNEEYSARKKVLELSSNVKGVYITKFIANAGIQDLYAKKVLEDIKNLIYETELNAVVIDVKEVDGFELSSSLRKLIDELHQENIWVIARFVAFRDSSLINERPELYLKNKDNGLWRDEKGYYWLDPASSQVQKYLLDLCYKVIDFEFDEIQFDYVRFSVKDNGAVYPIYNRNKEKQEIIRDFYLKIRNNLRDYKSDIVLSIDLFGEIATRSVSSKIGQSLADVVDVFDYVSFMLYPSHFFNGFAIGEVYFPYEDKDITKVVSNNPYEIVLRSIFSGFDYLSSFYSQNELQPQCSGNGFSFLFCPQSKIRPWLQDFDLKFDTERGIFYDAEKVKAQIKATEDSGASGWLLWNPSNIYTKEALLR